MIFFPPRSGFVQLNSQHNDTIVSKASRRNLLNNIEEFTRYESKPLVSAMKNEIAKRETPEERELRKKLAELTELEGRLGKKELELATFRAELNAFEAMYMRIVGVKYAELDEIEAKIAEAKVRENPTDKIAQEEAIQARARADESRKATGQMEGVFEKFIPSDTLKKLYRKVAKRIHPDLAEDAYERLTREKLMAKANRAYQEADIEKLRAILAEWEDSPESVKGKGAGADLVRLIRKIAQVEGRLRTIELEMVQLKESDLYKLKKKVEEAEIQGKDLLSEMAAKVEGKISKAKERLLRVTKRTRSV